MAGDGDGDTSTGDGDGDGDTGGDGDGDGNTGDGDGDGNTGDGDGDGNTGDGDGDIGECFDSVQLHPVPPAVMLLLDRSGSMMATDFDLDDPDKAFTTMVGNLLPVGMVGLIIAVLIALRAYSVSVACCQPPASAARVIW